MLQEVAMRRTRFGFGGVALGVVGTVGVLMLIPGGNDTAAPRQSAVSTSPALARFLDNALETRPTEKTSDQVIAEVAAGPEPGQPAPVQKLAVPVVQTVAATTTAPVTPTGPRELVAARSAVNLRAGPSTSNPTLFVLQPDEQVAVVERQGGWAKVEARNGETGWVYGSYLGDGSVASDVDTTATSSIEPAAAQKPRVEKPIREASVERPRQTASSPNLIRLRAGPSRGAETIGTVEPGTPLRIAERRDGWARVVVPGGISGWVRVN
jgi:SH3-like domain-containing protein